MFPNLLLNCWLYSISLFFLILLFFLANCGSPSQLINGVIIPYESTAEGARVLFVCQNINPNSVLESNYTVSTCSKKGNWEPNPRNFCTIITVTPGN